VIIYKLKSKWGTVISCGANYCFSSYIKAFCKIIIPTVFSRNHLTTEYIYVYDSVHFASWGQSCVSLHLVKQVGESGHRTSMAICNETYGLGLRFTVSLTVCAKQGNAVACDKLQALHGWKIEDLQEKHSIFDQHYYWIPVTQRACHDSRTNTRICPC